jgi:hypothetical protein
MPVNLPPEIEFHLNFTPYEPYTVYQDERGFYQACRKGVSLYGGPNEVAQWFKKLPLESIDLLYIYGIGLGYYYLSLQDWLAQDLDRSLIFLEDDLGALSAFLEMDHAADLLNHPQVALRYISTPKMWETVIEECSLNFYREKVYTAAINAYRSKAIFKRIRSLIVRKTAISYAAITESLQASRLNGNILRNLLKLPNSFYVNRWNHSFKNIPAIICGAGPSLEEDIEELKLCQQSALIIAGGSTLSALSYFGVPPHLGIAIDPNAREYDCLKGCTNTTIPFLYGGRLLPKALELFQGPVGYIRSGTGGSCEAYVEELLDLQEEPIGPDLGQEALSVTTLATAVAVALGCNPIIFVGVDMAYTDKKLYAQGVLAPWMIDLKDQRAAEQMVAKKNRDNERIYTLVKWMMESDTLSNYAKLHKSHSFYNSSRRGLGFKSIPYKSLNSLRKERLTQKYSIEELVEDQINKTRFTLQTGEIRIHYQNSVESLDRCLGITEKILSITERSVMSEILEIDLQAEPVFKPLLEGTLLAFTLAFHKKYPLTSTQSYINTISYKKWIHLKESITDYLGIFKSLGF